MLFMRAIGNEYTLLDRTIFSIPELSIHKGDRIGLVGRNGEGKSLLLHYLMGELEEKPNIKWWVEVDWMKQLHSVEHDQLSGGEKTIQQLEQVFETRHPLLFLDEPTNNLDWQQIEKLESQLVNYEGAYVIVSHDRKLLDRTCQKVWELEAGQLNVFEGNYSFYAKEKELERLTQQKKYEQYVEEKKRIKERIRKKNDQTKQMRKPPKRMGRSEWQLGKNKAASKQKKVERVGKTLERRLDRLEKVEKPFEWDKVKMSQAQALPVSRRFLVSLEKELIYAGERKLFEVRQATIPTGSKLAIVGGNGAGKTTLIDHLLFKKKLHEEIEVAYFNQDLTSLPLDLSVYQYVSESSPLKESEIRIILGRLNFIEEDMNKKISVLSGGERVKLALARLMTRKAHLLILDEPTNHLDLEAIQSLESLINDYPGTVLFVSHDRTFVERTANHLWMIEDGELIDFEGSLHEWNQPKPKAVEEYDDMMLQNKLTEIISRLSLLAPQEDKSSLEEEYAETLRKLKESRSK